MGSAREEVAGALLRAVNAVAVRSRMSTLRLANHRDDYSGTRNSVPFVAAGVGYALFASSPGFLPNPGVRVVISNGGGTVDS